jgi:hypothetical protein
MDLFSKDDKLGKEMSKSEVCQEIEKSIFQLRESKINLINAYIYVGNNYHFDFLAERRMTAGA